MNIITKESKITVFQAYKAMYEFLSKDYKSYKGVAFETINGLLSDLIYDEETGDSMDPMCWSRFSKICGDGKNERDKDVEINFEKAYKSMIDFLSYFIEPWKDGEDKQTILNIINSLINDK
ncbi:hypothetical protein ACFLYH_01780, partial [Candidatus Dependentiae bacterium]